MTIVVAVSVLAILIVIGVPVGYSMAAAGALGLWLHGGETAMLGILSTSPYRESASWLLVALPMFILMAEFMTRAGMARRLFNAAYVWLQRIPGSLAVTTVVSTALFGAVSGSSSAATATMAKTAIPEMQRYGYDDRLSLGVVAAAGSLAMMLPPSVVLIIYGILTEVSIGKLFLAGIIPGILTAIVYIVVVVTWAKVNPNVVRANPVKVTAGAAADPSVDGGSPDAETVERSEVPGRLESLKGIGPTLLLFLAVMGGIYSGVVTVTEAASVGAGGALLIALLSRSLSWTDIKESLVGAAKTTGMIFTIIIGAHIFGYFLTMTRATVDFINFVESLPVDPWVILVTFLLMYLLLGFVMDQLAILVLTVPLVFPVIVELGFDPIWFGILLIKTVEIGLATPPLGLNVFISTSMSGISLGKGFRGVSRFVASDLVVLALMVAVPGIVLVLT